jgi:hypothetical protein
MDICKKYYRDLSDKAMTAIVKMCLKYPSIWECYNVRTGELARSDHGFVCTPGVSSNVGAGDIIGTLYTYRGLQMYEMNPAIPIVPMQNVHHKGLRISIRKNVQGFVISAKKAECESAHVDFIGEKGRFTLELSTEKEVLIRNA